MAGAGVNGLAVGLATGGGLLLWAGIRNVTFADTLRDVLGMPNSGRLISTPFNATESGLGTYVPAEGAAVTAARAAGNNAAAGTLVTVCRSQIGKPYVWGASGPNSFDCSGLMVYALRRSGYPDAPRFYTGTFGAWAKSKGWTRINDPGEFKSGDVVLKAGHMGVCSGPGMMINAPRTGANVREESLWKPLTQWWGWRMPAAKGASQEAAELRRIG
jgi:cell wall-associated NlpC family hydrolase